MLHVTSTHFAASVLKTMTGSNRQAALHSSTILGQGVHHSTISRAASPDAREKGANQAIEQTFIEVASDEYADVHGIPVHIARRIFAFWLANIASDWRLYQAPEDAEVLAEDASLVESTLNVLSGDDLLSTVLRATVTLHGMRNPLFDQAVEQDITLLEQTLKRVVAENAYGYAGTSFETLLAPDWISDPRTDLTGLLLSTALLTLNGLVASKGADAWAEFLGTLEAESRLPLLLVRGRYMNDPVQLLSAAEAIWLAGRAVDSDFETTVRKVVQAAKLAWKKPLATLPGYETYLEPNFKAWIEKNK